MKSNQRYYPIALIIAICAFIETATYTYVQQQGGTFYYSSSILYALSGLIICIAPLFLAKPKTEAATEGKLYRFIPYIFYLFLAGLLAYHLTLLIPLYRNFKIDKQWADMIPCIQLACKRFLNGQTVYGPTPEIKPDGIIPYLPTMWMPFLPAEAFNFDPRWITLGATFIALAIVAIPLLKAKRIPILPAIITLASLFLFFNYFLMKYTGFWPMIEEPIVAAFYLLLGYALLKQKHFWVGITMGCCMYSRYALLFWIPVYFGYLFFTHQRKAFWITFLTFTAFSCVIFLPFFLKDPAYFFNIPKTYGDLAWFWDYNHIPEKLYYGVGFFKFFTRENVHSMFVFQCVLSFIGPAIFMFVARRMKKKYPVSNRYIAFGSLKLSILFFYGFIMAPFQYLFFTCTLISYALMFYVLAYNRATAKD